MPYLPLGAPMSALYMLEYGDIQFIHHIIRTLWFFGSAGYGVLNSSNGIGGPSHFLWCVVIMVISEGTSCNILETVLCSHWVVIDIMARTPVIQKALYDGGKF